MPEGEPRLPLARRLLRLWGCEPDGAPFATHSSLLWPVRQGGAPAMLKLADPGDDEAEAPALLAALDGRCAVRLLARDGAASLMERAMPPPGPSLSDMALGSRDDEATAILCRVVGAIHAALDGAAIPALIPFDRRAGSLRRALRDGSAPPEARPGFEAVAALLDRLIPDTRPAWAPLHGDVHHGNVLRDARRGWLAIDPKGLLGPRGYDYANLLLNPPELGPEGPGPARLARRVAVAEAAGAPPARELLLWAWLHAHLAASWDLQDPRAVAQGLACARAAEALGAPG